MPALASGELGHSPLTRKLSVDVARGGFWGGPDNGGPTVWKAGPTAGGRQRTGARSASNGQGSSVSKLMESSDLDIAAEDRQAFEVALVLKAQGGDSDAFAELVRRYQRRTVSVAYRLLGNLEDASDVSQDAFVRAYRYLEQLDDPSRFGPWLLRVVSNLALNYRRSRKSRSAASLDDAMTVSAEVRRPTTGQKLTAERDEDDGALPEELRSTISEALERLPDKQRLALVLFSVEGMPQKEVAEVLECSIELVKWNVFQARKKLRVLLQDYL